MDEIIENKYRNLLQELRVLHGKVEEASGPGRRRLEGMHALSWNCLVCFMASECQQYILHGWTCLASAILMRVVHKVALVLELLEIAFASTDTELPAAVTA